MDYCSATDSSVISELLIVQAILAGTDAALGEAQRSLPPLSCTWEGTARQVYALNLTYLVELVGRMAANIADARSAVSSAISAA